MHGMFSSVSSLLLCVKREGLIVFCTCVCSFVVQDRVFTIFYQLNSSNSIQFNSSQFKSIQFNSEFIPKLIGKWSFFKHRSWNSFKYAFSHFVGLLSVRGLD